MPRREGGLISYGPDVLDLNARDPDLNVGPVLHSHHSAELTWFYQLPDCAPLFAIEQLASIGDGVESKAAAPRACTCDQLSRPHEVHTGATFGRNSNSCTALGGSGRASQ